MTAVAFDTLAYAKRLQEAGMEPKLAEAEAQALADVLQGSIAELATKQDLKELENRLTLRLGGLIAAGVAVLAVLAMFGLKYPSLLKFDEAQRQEAVIRADLKSLYGVEQAPCDTPLRSVLDAVEAAALRPAFAALHHQLQRQGALKAYRYLDGYYLLSVDGTGQFGSTGSAARSAVSRPSALRSTTIINCWGRCWCIPLALVRSRCPRFLSVKCHAFISDQRPRAG